MKLKKLQKVLNEKKTDKSAFAEFIDLFICLILSQ
jgi:hypothetical protein